MRSAIYYQITQYILILILFLRPYELNIYLETGILIFTAILVVFVGMIDRKSGILKMEQSIANSENKELTAIYDKLLEIEEKIGL
jgi:hypothetical protein